MEKANTPSHMEWLALWQKALDLATSEAIPENVFDSDTRSRLTVFLCCEALESGRRERKSRPKGQATIKQLRIDGKPADILQ